MLILLSGSEGKITIGDRVALVLKGGLVLDQLEGEVQFADGTRGQIRSPAPFFDCPPFTISVNDQPVGELRFTTPGQPEGRLRVLESSFEIESRGPWTLLIQGETEAARIVPAWGDSQISEGVLAEVKVQVEIDDWALASFVFTWAYAERLGKALAGANAAIAMGIIASS